MSTFDPEKKALEVVVRSESPRQREVKKKSPVGERAPELAERVQRLVETPAFLEKRDEFEAYSRRIPDRALEGYVKRLESAVLLAEKSPVTCLTQMNGVLFELSRITKVVEQGLETIDFDRSVAEEVSYKGYDAKEKDFSEKHRKPKKSHISSDVPVLREVATASGEKEQKPYVYETKCYPRMVYGASAADRNQVLKYQKAIEDGKIAGATVEVAGRIDGEFLKWLIGESLVERGAAPDVEVIYSLELPSGAEYRLVLNSGQPQKGLRFLNDLTLYTQKDQEVITGIFGAVLDHSIISILSSNEVKDPSETLRPLLDDPYTKIVTRKAFDEYTEGRKLALHEAFRKKAESALVNVKNERSSVEIMSYSEEEQKIALGQIFDHFQETLHHDPALQAMRERYAVDDAALREEMIEHAYEMVKKVATFEQERATKKEKRPRPGYQGKPEGVALSVDSIVFDAVYNVLRMKKGEMPRSYDQPERFEKVRLDNVMEYLKTQERTYHTCEIYDPITGMTESFVGDGTPEARRPLEKRKTKIAEENERRLREAFKQAISVHGERERELEAKEIRTAHEARELRVLAGKSSTDLREIKNLEKAIDGRKTELRSLSHQKASLDKELKMAPEAERSVLRERVGATMRLLQQRSKEYAAQNQLAQDRIFALYKQVIGHKAWQDQEIRIVSEETRNLVKFIYTVTADEEVLLCEEFLKGNTKRRSTHSEVARGRNVYGAGEIVFEKPPGESDWSAQDLNNGSGHYRPSRLTLPYVAHLVGRKVDLSRCKLNDVLSRGVAVPEYNAVLQTQTA